jgi:hypothetical protein
MKIAFAFFAFLAYSSTALAAGPECRAIESNAVRLTCYDAAFPPLKQQSKAVEKDGPRSPYKDPFLEEEMRTNPG